MTTRRLLRLEDLGRCVVCEKPIKWPSIHFCSPHCSEAWIKRHREEEQGGNRRGWKN